MTRQASRTWRGTALGRSAAGTFVLMLAACGVERLDSGDESGTGDGGGEVPVWVQDAFTRSCATAGCHASSGPQAGLSLAPGDSNVIIGGSSTQSELPLVELGNIEGSFLALKILPDELLPEGFTRPNLRMPPVPTDESEQDVAAILGWIAGTPAFGVDERTLPVATER